MYDTSAPTTSAVRTGRRVASMAIACTLADGVGPVAVRSVWQQADGDPGVLAQAHLDCLTRGELDEAVRARAAELILRARQSGA